MKRRCANPDCNQEFSINENFQGLVSRDDFPDEKVRRYMCPYCGHIQGGGVLQARSGQGYTQGEYIDPNDEAHRGRLIAASVVEWRHPGRDQSHRCYVVSEFTSDSDNISGSLSIDRHGRIWIEARYGCRPDMASERDVREFRAVLESAALIEGFVNAIRGVIEPITIMQVQKEDES